jgi:hypothetical protein
VTSGNVSPIKGSISQRRAIAAASARNDKM